MKSHSTEAIRCENLACGYPGRQVLSDVNLTISTGEIVAVLGVNGSGKSTLLKTIAKNLVPAAGTIYVEGNSVASLSHREIAKHIAYVPQEEHSEFAFTVEEVVLMGRMPHSAGLLDSKEDLAAAEKAMEQVGCLDLRNRSVLELSGGEKQRVLLARALAQGAPILLLDEPTSHLDVAHQVELYHVLRRLSADNYCIMIAIHDLNLAAAIAERALLLDEGKLSLDAPSPEVLQSDLLEKAYDVRFERSAGRVFPVF